MGNVEFYELCETIPKVQCSECLLYWNQGVTYCTCGHFLVESESSQKFSQWRLDALSIKKGRPHGARHGKTEAQKEYYVAHNARKRCLKRNYDGIHDRFLRDPENRDSQLKKLAGPRKSASRRTNWHRKTTLVVHCLKSSIDIRNWKITQNKSGKNAPMRLRSDFRAAVTLMNLLHREPGDELVEPIPFQQYQRWHPSSSSSSWWNWDKTLWRS